MKLKLIVCEFMIRELNYVLSLPPNQNSVWQNLTELSGSEVDMPCPISKIFKFNDNTNLVIRKRLKHEIIFSILPLQLCISHIFGNIKLKTWSFLFFLTINFPRFCHTYLRYCFMTINWCHNDFIKWWQHAQDHVK